ncbi:MAG: putative ABC transport system permease protein [Gammaproteobacteria bacterium]|jgi:putative ABC transport system permease protein
MVYTTCPICRTRYRLSQNVATSQGIVECSECDTVFDALVSLIQMDFNDTVDVTDRTIVLGDRQLIRSIGLVAAKPWYPSDEIREAIANDSSDNEAETSKEPLKRASVRFGNFNLALRNLIRYRRRTAVALSAIVFGVVAILLAGGFIEWVLDAMRESAIRSQYGHVQVVRGGYFKHGAADPLAYILPAKAAIISKIEGDSTVDTVAPRLYFTGLASRDETTISFIGQGVDPAKEALLSESVIIRTGENLDVNDPSMIIVGAGLAEILEVTPGDTLVLLTTSSEGGINAVEVTVRGIFVTAAKAFDDSALRVHIDTARELLRVSGSHSWLVLLNETDETDRMKGRIDAMIGNQADEYEVIPWYELADFYNKTEQLFSRQINLVWIVIGLLILLSISNTMMMSVLERTREIGTLMAVGLTRRSIMRLFLQEGIVLGGVGGIVGLILGISLAALISKIGIPMPPPPGMDIGYTAEILITGELVAAGLFVAMFATTAAAAYPAWKASQLNVVDALRHNQ